MLNVIFATISSMIKM